MKLQIKIYNDIYIICFQIQIKMASTGLLKTISTELLLFGEKPKIIDGRKIYDWFKVGENVFEYLFNLGKKVSWDFSQLKNDPECTKIIALVTQNIKWIETFISLYPNFRIDCDMVGSAGDICRTRSGVEILLKGFNGIDRQFDVTLKSLEEDVEEFDRVLKIWINTGHRPDFAPTDVLSNIPQLHWWWF